MMYNIIRARYRLLIRRQRVGNDLFVNHRAKNSDVTIPEWIFV